MLQISILGMSSDFMNKATPTIRIVYKHWGGRDVVAEELRKTLENRDKVAGFGKGNASRSRQSLRRTPAPLQMP
jgi:hypothetical protein